MKTVKGKRYGLGFNGHALSCDCTMCAKSRASVTLAKWYENGKAAEIDLHKTIFVRSYFRAGPHFTKMPNSRRALAEALRSEVKRSKRRAA